MADDDRVRVDVLGPIRAFDADGREITPDGALQRRLLALLVLRRGRTVSVEAAIDALWPAGPPRDPLGALHNQVFRLRRRLPDGLIESDGDGYRLMSTRVDVDADRLADVLNAGPAGPDQIAAIDATLVRWQGPAYPELDDVDEGRVEAARLAELRVRGLEVRADSRLAAGDVDAAIAELAALAHDEPLRERPRELLMTALANAGRHAEALRVYDDFRRLLGAELGIEPSPSLTAHHAELLAGAGVAAWAAVDRLPVPATSLIGREDLTADVEESLDRHRVVTLIGPGGVGKTRLAVDVGHRLQAARPDRPVIMCELSVATPASAVDTVAEALRIDVRPGVSTTDRVAAVVGDSDVVVVLDNCEHVLDPIADLVDRVVARCPHVRVLATSRERLRVSGERVVAVPSLPGDDEGPAVQLFLERALAVAPDFTPTGAELAGVAEIVRRLDGLPLAIELAAARLHTHDVAEVASGLDRRFALLTSGSRTSPRHGSLGAAVSWSVGLLDEHLQRTFTELSVFAGPFSAADAAAVCSSDPAVIGDALTQLVERSLLVRVPGRTYVLLETLRAFGGEQLVASGRADEVGRRHAHHQVVWIERVDHVVFTEGAAVTAEIDAAVPELRNALEWMLAHDEVDAAGRLVTSLLDYGVLRQRPDVLAWGFRVADADPEGRSPWAPYAWVAAAYAGWMIGEVAETGPRAQRAIDLSTASGGSIPPRVAVIRGNAELFEGRLDAAVSWYRRAVESAVDDRCARVLAAATEVLALGYAGDPAAAELADELLAEFGAATTPYAAYVWYCAGESDLATDVGRARVRLTTAIEVAERTGASLVTGLAGASRASLDARLGDPLAAAEDYRRLIAHWRRAGVWSTQWTMLRSVAALLERLGRARDAAVLEGAVRATTAGHRIFGADETSLAELGARLREALGDADYEAARREGAALDGDAAAEHALRSL